MTTDLCLGTAQFGLAYGVTNRSGKVSEDAVATLLLQAEKAGIRWLDTAQAYGDAETVLGRHLAGAHKYRIISKLPAQRQLVFNSKDADIWEQTFMTSCKRLGINRLEALLLHAPADLTKPGGDHLEAWLIGLRKRGLVKRIGLSIYSADDLEGINPELLDLVQLPLSLYDQRMLHDGTLTRLQSAGTAIHARSVYLQGLLLTPAAQWPHWINSRVRQRQQELEELARQRNCQLIDLALGFVRSQNYLEAAVLGVCSIKELTELESAWTGISPWEENEWRNWALEDADILDPRSWPG